MKADMRRRMMDIPGSSDVVVIGAGPAGARTAECLASMGYQTLLLEREKVIGEPVQCTGVVSSECFERYELPEELILRQINSFVLRSPSGRGVQIKRKHTQAYVLDRVELDQELVNRAVTSGVKLYTEVDVTDVGWIEGKAQISCKVGPNEHQIQAKITVVATGYGSSLSRKLGFSQFDSYVSGSQAIVEAEGINEIEVFTGSTLGKGGFGWIVPWRENMALVGLLTREHTVSYMHALIKKLQDQGRIGSILKTYRTRAIPVGIPRKSVADGILAVGDIVSQAKPTSGGGIHYSMMAADLASTTINEALIYGDHTKRSLAAYETRWHDLLEHELNQGVKLRGLIEQLPDFVIEQLHRMLSFPGAKRLLSSSTFDWHSGSLIRVLEKLQIRRKDLKNE